jgi:hypothetical protein
MVKQGSVLNLKRCPHCNVAMPNLSSKNAFETSDSEGRNKRRWIFYICSFCGGVVMSYSKQGDPKGEVQKIYPKPQTVDERVPDKPREYLLQAIDSKHAPAGSIMLCASSIDAMLKEKGYTEGSLNSRINKMAEDHLITNGMAEWAHYIRLEANDQRHADENAGLPTKDDAQKTIDFAMALAEFLYVLPARVSEGIEDSQNNSKDNEE